MARLRLICLLALRYTLPGGDRYAAFVTLVSCIGTALGLAVLLIVASIMNGFGEELRYRLLGSIPQLVAYSDDFTREDLAALPEVLAVGRFVSADAMLSRDRQVAPATVYGVEPAAEADMSILPAHMTEGGFSSLAPGARGVILGRVLAWQLGAAPGDRLLLVVPVASGETVRPRSLAVRVTGIFEVGAEVDAGVALMHWRDLLAADAGLQAGWRLRLQDSGRARQFAARLRALAPAARIEDWSARYGDLFTTVQMEKIMMFLLLLLVVAISTFNVVSGLVMLVNEKRGEIAILNTLGLATRDLVQVFQLRGLLLTLAGLLPGLLLGCWGALHVGELVALAETLLGAPVLGGTYFTRVPSLLRPGDILLASLLTLLMSLLATLVATRKAAGLQPSLVLGR